jgi:hypothetical protein
MLIWHRINEVRDDKSFMRTERLFSKSNGLETET